MTLTRGADATDRSGNVHGRCADLASRWRVSIAESFETETSLIAYGQRDTVAVVLKVVKQPGDEWKSGEVASAFGGAGVVRVYECVDGAALYERVSPGTALVELSKQGRDEQATSILADVIRAMVPGIAPAWCPTVSDWARGFTWYKSLGDTQIPLRLVARASEMYHDLCVSQGDTRLLHGDLQHYNVLADHERGWVAIDPKGVVGEVAYEVGAALRNPVELPDVFANAATIEKRVSSLSSRLNLDADRVLRWAFAQGVLSAIWQIEDGYTIDSDNVPLQLVRALEPMLGDRGA